MKTLVLTDGLRVGDTVHKEVEFKDITAGDILEATEAAERIVTTRDGHAAAVVSDARLGMEILRRRIAKADDVFGHPLAWPESEAIALGGVYPWDAGNVNVVAMNGKQVAAWYSGLAPDTAIYTATI